MSPEKLIAIADIVVGVAIGVFLWTVVFLVVRSFRVTRSHPENVRRLWTLHRPDGSVPLGIMTQLEAIMAAAKLGARVTFVDREFGLIFADTHLQIERHEGG